MVRFLLSHFVPCRLHRILDNITARSEHDLHSDPSPTSVSTATVGLCPGCSQTIGELASHPQRASPVHVICPRWSAECLHATLPSEMRRGRAKSLACLHCICAWETLLFLEDHKMPISVALVEDDAQMRARLCAVISSSPAIRLAFAASCAGELLHWFSQNFVDVLLVDLGLPDRPGLEVIRECCRMQPSCAVMVITMFGDEESMLLAFESGARGYLLKDGTESDLASHVRSLHAGGSPMTPIIARQLLARWQADTPTRQSRPLPPLASIGVPSPEGLSKRESAVLDLIARGFTYAEVAHQLAVSVSTVQTHVKNIYSKLGVHNKAEAVYEARATGLLR